MKLFDITLPNDNICSDSLLYYRAADTVIRKKNQLIVPKGQSIGFDTYFNCFSYHKYLKYTILTTLGISLSLKGQFEVSVYQITSDNPHQKICLHKDHFNSDTQQDMLIQIDINNLDKEGFLYLELTSKQKDSVFFSGYYFADNTTPTKDTVIALVFCTFRREEYLYRNYNNINYYLENNPDISDNFSIIVVDNGGTVNADNIKNAYLYKNKNLGGSGGFTRGIIEASNNKKHTHFLLMDDDIVFDTKILRKTLSFIALAKDSTKLALGGAMLELDRQYYQYEMGGKTTGLQLLKMKNGLDVRTVDSILTNEVEDYTNYNAWWYMCMPITAIDKGLPLPLFIKGDDVEYGLRFEGDIAVLNGVAVWHESFDKKYSGELEYYVKRNELIITALYFPKIKVLPLMKKLIRAVGINLVYQRYYEAEFIFRAYTDFLRGASFLINTDALQLHQDLRKNCPMYLGEKELKEQYNIVFDEQKYNQSLADNSTRLGQYLTLNGYLIPRLFYKDKHSFRVVDVNKLYPINFYKANKVLHYNANTRTGFVTQLKKHKVLCAGLKIIKLFFMMLFKYKKARQSFKDNYAILTSLAHWQKILELD